MGAVLTVDNQLDQSIHVFPYERPGWVVADVLLDIGLFAVGVGEIKSVVTTAQLPADISTAADLLKFLNIARQLAMGLIGSSSRSAEAATSIIKAFMDNTIVVSPGQKKDIREEGLLGEIFSASGWAGLLGAETMDLAIMTADHTKLVNFTTPPDATWEVTRSAVSNHAAVTEHVWDGEATTTSRLGMATVGGRVWVAGRAENSEAWSIPLEGGVWQARQPLPSPSADGPGLANFRGRLHVAARGAGQDQGLWWASHDGISWGPSQRIPGASSFVGPMLAEFQNRLYAVSRGQGADQGIWITSFDGTSWTDQVQIPGKGSTIGPAVTAFQKKLYLMWKGPGGDQGIWFSSFDGNSWSNQEQIPGIGSTVGPSLAVFGNRLYAAWRGAGNDESIWFSSFDGNNWVPAPQSLIPGVGSSVGPALAADDTKLYAAWRGAGPDDTVWWTSFDGNMWAPQHHVSALVV